MAITHKGYTLAAVADAIGAVIQSAYEGKPVEIFTRWTLSYLNDDETLDASKDEKTGEIDRWDVLPYSEGKQRQSEPFVCEGGLTVTRKKVQTFLLKFRYSVGVEDEKDDQNLLSSSRFFERLEKVGDWLSGTPYLIAKTGTQSPSGLHTELQIDRISIVGFHREMCHEAICRITAEVRDSVTKTE